jgi:hypothetical protein
VAAATLAFATVIANHGRPPGDHYHLVTAKEQKNSSPSAQAVTTYKEDQLLYEAEQDLTRDCMRRAGFQYQVSSFTQSASVPSLQMLYFISSPGWAERNGFGNKAGASTVTQDPNASYVSRLPGQRQAAFSLALYGTTQGSPQVLVTIPQGDVVGHSMDGCQAQAEEELYGSFRIWFRVSSIADNIPLAVLGRVINTILDHRRSKQSGITGDTLLPAGSGVARDDLPVVAGSRGHARQQETAWPSSASPSPWKTGKTFPAAWPKAWTIKT